MEKNNTDDSVQPNEEFIKSDGTYRLKILQKLNTHNDQFLTNNDIGKSVGNTSRVSEITELFYNKKLVSKYSEQTTEELKKYKKDHIYEVRNEGYKITAKGVYTYKKISENCFDPLERLIISKNK